ncbi:putative transcriptional regulator [Methylobacterium sp. PvP062]|uniref:Transcriptional regulator n=1 Tax=Methylobacterium radiotolerans TaxID=31998 RepID=A0ABV2NQ02_9HYPH|nr:MULTISPECIES: MucR family transcriptional regulator [unclassified Methylobacterium]MBP2494680.1 putative transcriptional regulator [Methylobacterium sp. PvP105]MBP2505449.1 putative transcriptional regulator [Methylobacterium sp. PvP109]MCX7336344.1 MucR family transcriptional regulator [Hyphomicrobiales bacterium]
MSDTQDDILSLTAGIVAAYVGRQAVTADALPGLMRTVRDGLVALQDLEPAAATAKPEGFRLTATEIRRSIRNDSLISFLDGKPYKTLKRHLTSHGLTPDGYRARFGLPDDYPMVAAGYAARRSALAKAIGLGVPGAQAARQAAE